MRDEGRGAGEVLRAVDQLVQAAQAQQGGGDDVEPGVCVCEEGGLVR